MKVRHGGGAKAKCSRPVWLGRGAPISGQASFSMFLRRSFWDQINIETVNQVFLHHVNGLISSVTVFNSGKAGLSQAKGIQPGPVSGFELQLCKVYGSPTCGLWTDQRSIIT